MRHLRRVPAVLAATVLATTACAAGSSGGTSPRAARASTVAPSGSDRGDDRSTTRHRQDTRAAQPRTASSSPASTAAGDAHRPRSATAAPSAAGRVPLISPGDYVYRAHGHAESALGDRDFDGRSRLTVTAPAADERHATLRGKDGSTEQTLLGRDDGLYLADLKMSQQGFNTEFRPASPVLLLPAGAEVGKRWEWRMTSTDGDYRLHATLTLTDDNGSATVDGSRVSTATVKSVLVIEGDSLSM